LARNADSIDDVVNNTKQATASIRDLADHLDKRTEEITTGVNKVTDAATKQIDIVGGDAHRTIIHIDRAVTDIDKAVTDLAKNPQRFLFGGGGSK
jgi:phospholipid/cholesterol/gamma-HCH transport system substrate-binding protein